MTKLTKPVSIRVADKLPDQIKAITGLPFSTATVMLLEAFVNAKMDQLPPHLRNPKPSESTDD